LFVFPEICINNKNSCITAGVLANRWEEEGSMEICNTNRGEGGNGQSVADCPFPEGEKIS